MDLTWEQVAIDLSMMQVTFHEMQNNDHVWGTYLSLNGFEKGMLPYPCPNCHIIIMEAHALQNCGRGSSFALKRLLYKNCISHRYYIRRCSHVKDKWEQDFTD